MSARDVLPIFLSERPVDDASESPARQRWTRRRFLGAAAKAGAVAWASGVGGCLRTLTAPSLNCGRGADKADLPNFVMILADDLGYGDLGCFGQSLIQTPNIDGIAAQGVRLTDFYVPASVCTPTRASLLTGRYPVRTGMTWALAPGDTQSLPESELTLAEALRQEGYATACIGKWHLGHHSSENLPNNHGFEYFYGIPYSHDLEPLPLYRNEQVLTASANPTAFLVDLVSEATAFIKRAGDRPFFLYLPHIMPHIPLTVPAEFVGKSAAGIYGDAVELLDWCVGEVLRALAEQGVDRNTAVCFTSDNGPRGGINGGSAGPLRGGKWSVYEGGVRVPFVFRWPAMIPPSTVNATPVSILDLLPTFLDVAGCTTAPGPLLDGTSALQVLGGFESRLHDRLYFLDADQIVAIRAGRWKLHLPRSGQPAELYDLEADIGERVNLAGQQTEVVTELENEAQRWRLDVRAGPN